MKCPYCPAQIAYLGEKHDCPYPELSSGDPLGPEDFGGTDEGSHYMGTIQGEKHLHPETQDEKEEGVEVVHHDLDNPPRDLPGTKTFLKEAPKQVIVMRTDLKMRKGKMIAQGSHASMKVLLDRCAPSHGPLDEYRWTFYTEDKNWQKWIDGIFAKICVRVESEQELIDIYERALGAGLPCALITDAGRTEFHGVPTKTCCAIGPALPEDIDPITGHLKLL